jgi:hypothetical protein
LLRADAYCQNNSRCLFHFKGKVKVGTGQGIDLESVLTPFSTQAYQQILGAAHKAPLPAKSCANNTVCYSTVTEHDVQQALQGQLTTQPDFPAIFEALESV